MNEPVSLTLEQQFALRRFEAEISQMSREQCQEALLELCRQRMVQQTMYKQMIKQDLGI